MSKIKNQNTSEELMYIIGLTGGIASGKSSVSNILKQEFKANIIDLDVVAREITTKNSLAYTDIINYFGPNILEEDGQINRKKLGKIVFADRDAKKKLEEITHFRILEILENRLDQAKKNNTKLIFIDSPLLIETNWHNKVNEVWLVYVNLETQISRLMERDTISYEDAIKRIESQISLEEKRKYATVIINNNDSFEKTKEQVISSYKNTYNLIKNHKL
ncbi:dephospho-CoA kinase [Selenomonadales bacterium OttesenSCG-928-I06]|nr:dephospho-CoA kinase [Selenomonadales bacterium OttesenSCG-928-I06]